nr:chemotaxis protein CheW [uncultured Methanospirillum sp.]
MTEFLIFMVAGRQFGIPVPVADHVVRMVEITRVSAAPEAVAGIINYHGMIIPVFSLRARFLLPDRSPDPIDLLIVTSTTRRKAALIADQVIGVMDISEDLIDADSVLPGMIGVHGVVKTADGMILITDPDQFLLPDEEETLSTVLKRQKGDKA